MAIEPTLESAITAQRANLLNQIGNSAQGSQAASAQTTVNSISDQIRNDKDDANKLGAPPAGTWREAGYLHLRSKSDRR